MALSSLLLHPFPTSNPPPLLPPPPTTNVAILLPTHPYSRNNLTLSNQLLPIPKLTNNTVVHPNPLATKHADDNTLLLSSISHSISDRVEMHRNICTQRDNWNSLFLNSINLVTFTATTIAAISSSTSNAPLSLNIVSSLLFSAATGMLVIMNKIQPSQLAEEQRNAIRLFKELYNQVDARMQDATRDDVEEITRKVLALDRAYPLPLLGAMLDKFPAEFEPAVWWPSPGNQGNNSSRLGASSNDQRDHVAGNGWTSELETEMRAILRVVKEKDSEEYKRLGNIVLRMNKVLAIAGPLLTGIAAAASALVGRGPWVGIVAVAVGALAGVVNSLEHGGQVGMVFEMYRNSAGFFRLLEETIETALAERDCDRRENGEYLEMKVAMKLGRSLSQLRDLAANRIPVEEFASKLF